MGDPEAQLLYVCGSGHSGSTLLDLLLGGHSKFAALGEAHRIYASAHHDSRHHRCACGADLAHCPFWEGVSAQLQTMLGVQDPAILRSLPTTDSWYVGLDSASDYLTAGPEAPRRPRLAGEGLKQAVLVSGSRLLWRLVASAVPAARRDYRSAKNSLLVFGAIRRAHGRPVVVDSTKNPGRLKALYLQTDVPMRLLYLIRDGRAVCLSRMRREGLPMAEAARTWVAEQRRQRLVQFTIPSRRILQVHYEQLCTDPIAELGRVCRFVGAVYEPQMLDFRDGQRHSVGGNPMRFREGESAIRLDERWRRELAPEDRKVFDRIAGRQNIRFGYHP